jgi:hypothetical protein
LAAIGPAQLGALLIEFKAGESQHHAPATGWNRSMRLQDRKNVPRVRVNGRISEKLQNAMACTSGHSAPARGRSSQPGRLK